MQGKNEHLSEVIYRAFFVLVFLHAMAAYSLVGIPIQWMAQAGFVVLLAWVFSRSRLSLFPGATIFLTFLIWSLIVTIGNSTLVDYSQLMGIRATTSYPIYISLRFLSLLVFAATAGVTYWLCQQGKKDKIISTVSNIGVIIALIAIYIYLAQTYGWPEPPRTRVGTSGDIQKTVFTYAFHRALGTFREPSHMAQWLVAPLFCCYFHTRSVLSLKGFIIGIAMLLSGSLTGIVGMTVGLTGALMLTNGFRISKFGTLFKFASPFLVAWLVFTIVVSANSDSEINLFDTIWNRIEPIIYEEGVYSTNRSYVYEYVADQDIPFFGLGLGNANIQFGYDIGSPAMPSLLNLFVMTVLSTGIIGLTLLIIFMIYPLLIHFYMNGGKNHNSFAYLVAAYIAWVLMFIMHAEEVSMFFGMIYALIVYNIFEYYDERKNTT